jgi:uncharacterized Fe-S center protein
MPSKVVLARLGNDESTESVSGKITSLFNEAELGQCIGRHDLTAIKIHFGEKDNDTHIPPAWVRPIVEEIKKNEGKPFLTDTCVLYKGTRSNAVDHLLLAHDHGFTVEQVGAPVVIADGLLGNVEKNVSIPGHIFKSVSLSSMAVEANALIVLSHVTGHLATGIGAAVKNLGMGFASRKGKLRQHSVMKPAISDKKCTGCEVCLRWCPEDAISMKGDVAWIDSKRCIGCGECLTVCRFDAVKYDWKRKDFDLQKRMAEHALGVIIGRQEKVGYMNFLTSITKDCDCFDIIQKPLFPDIGILASKDPIAIDAASLDLIRQHAGGELTDLTYPDVDPRIQLKHGEEIGLGSLEYELVEMS